MNSATLVILIVAISGPTAAIVGPLLLARRLDRQQRRKEVRDYKRQDAVAARAAEVATQAAETARLLLERQDAAATRQDEVAAKAAEVASKLAETTTVTNGKLDDIHRLVNSNMSTAMQSELDALETSLAMMREVVDLKRAAGREPTREALAAIDATSAKIREARSALADRQAQADAITARERRETPEAD
jgi:hypothetical protein